MQLIVMEWMINGGGKGGKGGCSLIVFACSFFLKKGIKKN
jgi:hypothetical protein